MKSERIDVEPLTYLIGVDDNPFIDAGHTLRKAKHIYNKTRKTLSTRQGITLVVRENSTGYITFIQSYYKRPKY